MGQPSRVNRLPPVPELYRSPGPSRVEWSTYLLAGECLIVGIDLALGGKHLGLHPVEQTLNATLGQALLVWAVHSWAALWAYRRVVQGAESLAQLTAFAVAFWVVPFSFGLYTTVWGLAAALKQGSLLAGFRLAALGFGAWGVRRTALQARSAWWKKTLGVVLWHAAVIVFLVLSGIRLQGQLGMPREDAALFQLLAKQSIAGADAPAP